MPNTTRELIPSSETSKRGRAMVTAFCLICALVLVLVEEGRPRTSFIIIMVSSVKCWTFNLIRQAVSTKLGHLTQTVRMRWPHEVILVLSTKTMISLRLDTFIHWFHFHMVRPTYKMPLPAKNKQIQPPPQKTNKLMSNYSLIQKYFNRKKKSVQLEV